MSTQNQKSINACFGNVYQSSLTKLNTNMKKAETKAHFAPKIHESFVSDDDGLVYHNLENGNTISDVKYQEMWFPKKGKVLPKEGRQWKQ